MITFITVLTGARVIILNTVFEYCWEILNQAEALGMMGSGWAWIVTDGTTVSSERNWGINATAVVINVSKII